MFRILCANRWLQGGIVLCVVLISGSILFRSYFRGTETPSEPVKVYKGVLQSTEDQTLTPTLETQTQPACCENSEASGGTCCSQPNNTEITSTTADKNGTSLSGDLSNPDSTQKQAVPPSEERVVPDPVVQKANRFHEWQQKQQEHRKAWAAHRQQESQLNDDFQRQAVAMLMTVPIERRVAIFNMLKRQALESAGQDFWEKYSRTLYSYGLDFETEISPEDAETQYKQVVKKMFILSEQQLETSKEGQVFLETQKDLNAESDDFLVAPNSIYSLYKTQPKMSLLVAALGKVIDMA